MKFLILPKNTADFTYFFLFIKSLMPLNSVNATLPLYSSVLSRAASSGFDKKPHSAITVGFSL